MIPAAGLFRAGAHRRAALRRAQAGLFCRDAPGAARDGHGRKAETGTPRTMTAGDRGPAWPWGRDLRGAGQGGQAPVAVPLPRRSWQALDRRAAAPPPCWRGGAGSGRRGALAAVSKGAIAAAARDHAGVASVPAPGPSARRRVGALAGVEAPPRRRRPRAPWGVTCRRCPPVQHRHDPAQGRLGGPGMAGTGGALPASFLPASLRFDLRGHGSRNRRRLARLVLAATIHGGPETKAGASGIRFARSCQGASPGHSSSSCGQARGRTPS